VLVIDMIQFFIKMSAVIAAAYFAVELPQVGGMHGLVEKLSHVHGPGGLNYLNMLPDFTNNWDLAVAVFHHADRGAVVGVWYPGAEPGGGSYIAQRMLASKSEKDALGSTLFFNVAHYVLRPWPWILVGLASLIVYPAVERYPKGLPASRSQLIGHDIAFPAMLRFLPVGWMGLMLGGLIAANSSTILTHLNWGASYLVHDFYRRFVKPGESEKHYVKAGRWRRLTLRVLVALVFALDTAKDSFNIILQIGAGTGLLYLVRWFWWRVTAWCEIVAMSSSFGISILFLIMTRMGMVVGTYQQLLITIAVTTVCWIATAYFGPQTDPAVLVAFYKKVHPFGPGWRRVREAAGISPAQAAEWSQHENVPLSLLGWSTGCAMIWSALFTVGNFPLWPDGLRIRAAGHICVTAGILIRVINRLWN
jgi:solute:Na+ symporter, SSS family